VIAKTPTAIAADCGLAADLWALPAPFPCSTSADCSGRPTNSIRRGRLPLEVRAGVSYLYSRWRWPRRGNARVRGMTPHRRGVDWWAVKWFACGRRGNPGRDDDCRSPGG